jgi:alpha-mannosidase
MRSFVGARAAEAPEGPGLLVAAHGLREASVSPEGTIALTLLRCFGWLSRDDLSNRVGPAGPIVATPGGQCPGRHRYALSLIPFSGDLLDAAQLADAFQTQPRGVGTSLHGGPIAPTAAMLHTEPAAFRLSGVYPGRDEASVVVRGVYLGAEPGEVRIRPLVPPVAIERVRLDETPLGPVAPSAGGTIRIEASPHEIVSVQLKYPAAS